MPTRAAKCARLPATERVAEVRIHARCVAATCSARIGAVSSGATCAANPRGRVSAQRANPASGGSPPMRPSRPARSRARAATASIDGPRTDTVSSASASSASRTPADSIRSRASGAIALHSTRCTPTANASAVSRTALSRCAASGSRSGVSGASAFIAETASRASSESWPLVTSTPKNRVAMSGIRCASSMISVSADGSSSANPRSLRVMSANRRWWLATTTSASAARRRASTTWHPSNTGHFEPRQLSAVEVTARRSGSFSARSVTSARSPLTVRAAQPDRRATRDATGRETNRPDVSACSYRQRQR